MAKDIRELAYSQPEVGLPDRVKETIDNAVYGAGKKLWRGWLQVAASGFGKGLIITALAAVAITAGVFAFSAAGGAIMTGLGLPATVEEGFVIGATQGLAFLKSGFGVLAMAIGGTLGSIADMRKHQNRLTADVAQAQADQYALARQRQRAPEPAQAQAAGQEAECNFCAREEQRRKNPPQTGKWV